MLFRIEKLIILAKYPIIAHQVCSWNHLVIGSESPNYSVNQVSDTNLCNKKQLPVC